MVVVLVLRGYMICRLLALQGKPRDQCSTILYSLEVHIVKSIHGACRSWVQKVYWSSGVVGFKVFVSRSPFQLSERSAIACQEQDLA